MRPHAPPGFKEQPNIQNISSKDKQNPKPNTGGANSDDDDPKERVKQKNIFDRAWKRLRP